MDRKLVRDALKRGLVEAAYCHIPRLMGNNVRDHLYALKQQHYLTKANLSAVITSTLTTAFAEVDDDDDDDPCDNDNARAPAVIFYCRRKRKHQIKTNMVITYGKVQKHVSASPTIM